MILNRNDRVALIAPASQLRGADGDLLRGALDLLESWGLRVDLRLAGEPHFYLSGTDSVRAAHLHAALDDASVKAIFCLRGGYGTPRLLPYLDATLTPSPKMLIGYSDVTALHGAVAKLWPSVCLIHGPNLATRQLLGTTPESQVTQASLRDALFSEGRVLAERVRFLRPGYARGRLVGGCLSMLVSLLGTPYSLDTKDSILFLEDTGEAPYRVDRMLTHLKNAGKLNEVRGVIFGEMHNCRDPHNDIHDVISDVLGEFPFPIAFGLRSGHGNVNLSLKLGEIAELHLDSSSFHSK